MRYLTHIFILVWVAACTTEPRVEFVAQDIILQEDFVNAIGWDHMEAGTVSAAVEGEAYRIRADVSAFVRGFNSTPYSNVVIDVQTFQTTSDKNNAYGVVCRGSTSPNSSNGYYFLIGADGSYSIRIGQSQEVNPLVHWDKTDKVNQGAATNSIRVVCIDDYLALYINDEFVTEIRDSTYSEGYIGFTAAASLGKNIDVSFDNLIIRQGELK